MRTKKKNKRLSILYKNKTVLVKVKQVLLPYLGFVDKIKSVLYIDELETARIENTKGSGRYRSLNESLKRVIANIICEYLTIISDLILEGHIYNSQGIVIKIIGTEVLPDDIYTNLHTGFKMFRPVVEVKQSSKKMFLRFNKKYKAKLRENLENKNYYSKYCIE